MEKQKNSQQMSNEELSLALQHTKENVKRQASLAVISVAITVVLCFAMTVAWYSNILHTSDLTLKADSWNFVFEGDVIPGNDGIIAAPGESGTVNLSVANTTGKTTPLSENSKVSTIGVRVNIDKTKMQTMQSRVYFYVDEPYTIQNIGETIDRQYLSTQDSYLYTIYPGRTLTISEEYANDYPLKWEWVYDVVGYYIRGKRLDNGSVAVEEYIRPIVYDPEANNTEYDENGVITTILGEPVDTYIQENYLKKDGYTGSNATMDEYGYYEVDVTNDYGIYIYLCSKDEILANNKLDSTLATLTEPGEYSAKITLTGEKAQNDTVEATSSSHLASLINSGSKIIEINGDLEVTDALIVKENTDVMIDLKGHTLTLSDTIVAQESSSLGIMDGTIVKNSKVKEDLIWISATNAEIYIDNLIVDGFFSGIEAYDMNNVEDSHVYISQSQITTEDSVVWLRGNGGKSSRKTTLVIEGCRLESTDFIAVGGNGSLDYNGTDIKIMSSTIKGKDGAVYHPMSKSSLYISKSSLYGNTALAIKGGYVTVEDCTISSLLEPGLKNEQIKLGGSGYADTGDAIYIEDNYAVDENYEIDLIINGENTYVTSKGENTFALRIYQGTTEHVSVVINGGKFSSDVTSYIGEDKIITKITEETESIQIFEVNDKPAITD